MSTFAVSVVRIKAIEPIPNADAIELAVVGDYRSVVKKGDFAVDELAVYIPEAALVPQDLLVSIGLEGKLSGPEKNRVKAIKLRGCLSQGILLKLHKEEFHLPELRYSGNNYAVREGDNVAERLGITKWEPPIPTCMAGEVYAAGQHVTVAYDIENYKRFPDVLKDGEFVVFTEKIHGTFCGIGLLPETHKDPKHFMGEFVIFSKGLGAQGLCFKENEKNEQTVYVRALRKAGVFDKLREIRASITDELKSVPLFILGEVYGGAIQDAGWYSDDIGFRMFEICVGFRGDQHYFSYTDKRWLSNKVGLEMVPTLYIGPFAKTEMLFHTNGRETVSGDERNMREGIVMTPMLERYDDELGRVILKSVSEQYLLRKGGTEYN